MSEGSTISPAEVDPSDDADPSESSVGGQDVPREAGRAERIAGLEEILRLGEDETLERAYLFEPLEREDLAFSLALVVKRVAEDRLEMIAMGARAAGTARPVSDFVRRATFPDPVLPSILEEFIDRCGVEGSVYREIALADARAETGEPVDALTALARALFPE